MNIAVDISVLNKEPLRLANFVYHTLKLLTTQHPEHRFLFLCGKPLRKNFIFTQPVSVVSVSPVIKNRLLQKIWLQVRVPLALKKDKADIFVTFGNNDLLVTRVPQCMVVLKNKKRDLKFLRKAKRVVVFSEISKSKVADNFKIPVNEIDIVYAAASGKFIPLKLEEKEKIKKRYSVGKEFFLFNGEFSSSDDFIHLLKAFSHFKRRQQSNMQLLLAVKHNSSFDADVKTYQYRDDVKFIEDIDENTLAGLTASAYAVVNPFAAGELYISVLEALQCGVPVIASPDPAVKEITGGALLFSEDLTSKELGEKMIRIYTDENLRGQLAEKGKQAAAQYTLQRTTDLLWQTMLKTVN